MRNNKNTPILSAGMIISLAVLSMMDKICWSVICAFSIAEFIYITPTIADAKICKANNSPTSGIVEPSNADLLLNATVEKAAMYAPAIAISIVIMSYVLKAGDFFKQIFQSQTVKRKGVMAINNNFILTDGGTNHSSAIAGNGLQLPEGRDFYH